MYVDDGVDRSREMQFVLVGDSGAGKTSLSQVWSGDTFKPSQPVVTEKRIKCFNKSSRMNLDEEFTVNIWDIEGQEHKRVRKTVLS